MKWTVNLVIRLQEGQFIGALEGAVRIPLFSRSTELTQKLARAEAMHLSRSFDIDYEQHRKSFPAYCPRATDPDEYTYCCTYGYDWSMPTCCRYPLHAGLIYALCVGAFIVAAVLIFLSCWFCPLCPFAVRAHKVAKERNSRKIRQLLNDPDIFEDSYKPAYFR